MPLAQCAHSSVSIYSNKSPSCPQELAKKPAFKDSLVLSYFIDEEDSAKDRLMEIMSKVGKQWGLKYRDVGLVIVDESGMPFVIKGLDVRKTLA